MKHVFFWLLWKQGSVLEDTCQGDVGFCLRFRNLFHLALDAQSRVDYLVWTQERLMRHSVIE